MKNKDELLNDKCVSIPAAAAVGGKYREWKDCLENLSQSHTECLNPDVGKDMGASGYELEKKRVYYPPYTLDPETITFDNILNHAITKQNLSYSTASKYLALAKIMEQHSVFPVNFKHPHWTYFFQYMDHIKTNEYATPNALKNRRKAWTMFCRVWGTAKEWPSYPLPHIPDRTRSIVLPTPETVRDILQHPYTGDKYLNRLIQYHFFFGFLIGMRPPSEMAILNVDDLRLNEQDNYTITITEPKKDDDQRVLRLESNIAISKTRKSCKNYIDTIRPRFANRSESALFIDPETGKRWNTDRLRHHLLREYGKRVWPEFWPYVMRHWCGTARCIEWQNDHKVLKRVQYWLGHSPKRLDQTLRYLDLASLYNQGKGSWLSRALNHHNNIDGGMHGANKERIKPPKNEFRSKLLKGNQKTPVGP